MTTETLAQMLRRLRLRRGLSQNELAARAEIDAAYINRLERAGQQTGTGALIVQNGPSRTVTLKIAQALDLGSGETDRLLYTAGLAPTRDYQTIAEDLTRRFSMIEEAMAAWNPDAASVPLDLTDVIRRTA